MTQTRAITLNALSLYAVALVLAAAFAAQLILHELPCPLCLLQRIMFATLAVGPILNIRFGPRPSHYAMSLLAAVAGAVASTRQVLLHIMPGDAGYGSALLGYHYYTWALIGFIAAIVLLAAILLFDRQFEDDSAVLPATGGAFAQTAVWLVIALTAVNVVTTLLECGFGACADNPLVYELLKHAASRPLRNIQPALHRRPRQPALQPCRHMLQRVERNEFARTVEADQVAHPAEHGNVGDGVFIVHDPLPAGEMRLHHAEQALGLGDITLERPLVGKILAGEFMEEADLAEHRPDPAHLEMHPLDGLVSPRRRQPAKACRSFRRDIAGSRPDSNSGSGLPPGPSGSRIAGILPFGFSERNSGVFWSSLLKSTRCTSYGSPISSSMIETLTPFGVGSE